MTDGLGIFELLTLAEALGTEAQLSVFSGYSMEGKYPPLNGKDSQQIVQDALDLLEFANGPADGSVWGAKRALMGRIAPFGLRRLEIGNEERDMQPSGYPGFYRLISQAVWNYDPRVTIVACGFWDERVALAGNPCLSGQRCDMWDDHFYRTTATMASMGNHYDTYNRSWPKVFVGEYAAKDTLDAEYAHLQRHQRQHASAARARQKQHGRRLKLKLNRRLSLRAAVAEAIFLIGLERNADVVVASSFAPLLNNVHGTRWSYNLINFNSTHHFVLPSFHVLRLFRASLGAHTLRAKLSGGNNWLAATASELSETRRRSSFLERMARKVMPRKHRVAIKVANYAPGQTLVIAFSDCDATRILSVHKADVLSASTPIAENTLDSPEAVSPRKLAPAPTWDDARHLRMALPGWSVVVLTITVS